MGTRHRAAIGITEESDCISLIVSEETGRVSIAINGDLSYNLTLDDVRIILLEELQPKQILTMMKSKQKVIMMSKIRIIFRKIVKFFDKKLLPL